MPRLARELLKRARNINSLLPLLLRPCRDLRSARNELRWLRDFVNEQENGISITGRRTSLLRLCVRRSRGEPLQYLLGTEYFGDLEILCQKGVLIPRPDTENYVTYLASLLTHLSDRAESFRNATSIHVGKDSPLRILDLCTGTGCIPLLLHSCLSGHTGSLHVKGVDISPRAVDLARKNLLHNVGLGSLSGQASHEISFIRGDVMGDTDIGRDGFDIVVSNPPYVSNTSFNKLTELSVRRFEPRSALIPDHDRELVDGDIDLSGDVFYDKLMAIGQKANAKLLIMEVEDQAQAERIISSGVCSSDMSYWKPYAIWCDGVGREPDPAIRQIYVQNNLEVHLEGAGDARAVVFIRRHGEAAE